MLKEKLKMMNGVLENGNYQLGQFKFGELRKSKFVMVDNMEWFNVFGLIFIAVIMIPNVVFAIKCKDGFDNKCAYCEAKRPDLRSKTVAFRF